MPSAGARPRWRPCWGMGSPPTPTIRPHPDPTGRGALRSVSAALAQASLSVADIDYVNGHGTGTPANDRMERRVMVSLFGDRVGDVPISSTKSQVGHTLGASGAIEAITCVLALRDGRLPPTVNVPPGREDTLDLMPDREPRGRALGRPHEQLRLRRQQRLVDHRERGTGQATQRRRGAGAGGGLGPRSRRTPRRRRRHMDGTAVQRRGVRTVSDARGGRSERGMSGVRDQSLSPRGVAAPKLWRQMDNLLRAKRSSRRATR